jgi:hypothetical protein
LRNVSDIKASEVSVWELTITGDRIITAKGQVLEMEEMVLEGRRVRTWKNVSHLYDLGRSYKILALGKAGNGWRVMHTSS